MIRLGMDEAKIEPVVKPRQKRRGDPKVYRDYMRNFMREWRARKKVGAQRVALVKETENGEVKASKQG